MRRQVIVPIVEGHGEERSVPLLVRRWLEQRNFADCFAVPERAINAKGCGKLKGAYDERRHLGIEHYIRAALRCQPDAILVVLDADKECLHRTADNPLGPELLRRAREIAGEVPVSVVVANRTYEAWLVAGRAALARCDRVRPNVTLATLRDPESRAGSKAFLGEFMEERYSPTLHQERLTAVMSFSRASQVRAPSLAKLLRDLDRLTREARLRRKHERQPTCP